MNLSYIKTKRVQKYKKLVLDSLVILMCFEHMENDNWLFFGDDTKNIKYAYHKYFKTLYINGVFGMSLLHDCNEIEIEQLKKFIKNTFEEKINSRISFVIINDDEMEVPDLYLSSKIL